MVASSVPPKRHPFHDFILVIIYLQKLSMPWKINAQSVSVQWLTCGWLWNDRFTLKCTASIAKVFQFICCLWTWSATVSFHQFKTCRAAAALPPRTYVWQHVVFWICGIWYIVWPQPSGCITRYRFCYRRIKYMRFINFPEINSDTCSTMAGANEHKKY